ncbi:MAG: hypothetical protein GYA55_11375 [SAR324 cluster bacterium]|uniref:Uncharacterized protein n=1 Tax=SAR324 cluster bacterium TaxID=2024889 RepID=A0A7X9FTT0_9DELT|nr:hypothetical protein [SAR324 cluster bacterium]
MNSIINSINLGASFIIDLLLWPIGWLPKGLQLVVVSLLAGVVLLLFYGKVSNQVKLKNVKTKIYASFLEAVLFRHDGLVTLKAQGRMFRLAFVYFGYAVPAILMLAVPCILLLAQLNVRYGYRPLPLNEDVVLKVVYKEIDALRNVNLQGSENIEVLIPPIRMMAKKEASWRFRPINNGIGTLKLGDQEEKVVVGVDEKKIVNGRVSTWWLSILYPGLPMLSSESPIQELWIPYPEAYYRILGLEWHWILVFFVFSLLSGLLASKCFGVEI